jgi:hypothetical protein
MLKERISLFLGLIILGVGFFNLSCSSQPVLTFEEAVEIVIDEIVIPENLEHPLIVFALPDPLSPGSEIGPYNLFGSEPHPDPTLITEETWFFWIDDAPVASFSHTSRFVLISQENGQVTLSEEDWWPVLNGEGLWITEDEYWNEQNWVFTNEEYGWEEKSTVPMNHLASEVYHFSAQEKKEGTAIVINAWKDNEPGEEKFGTNSSNMHDLLNSSGFDVTYLGPKNDGIPASDRGGEATVDKRVDWFTEKAAELEPGDTVVVFINGHGREIEDGPRKGLGEIGNIREDFLQGDLARFDPGVHMIVILNSCESGSFSDSLSKVADITIVSTSSSDFSYGDLDFWSHGTRDINPDDEGSEFVSSMIEGWKQVMADKAKKDAARKRAEQSGTSYWEEVAAMAFVFGIDYDAAYQAGLTFPSTVRGAADTRPTPIPATATATSEPPPKQSLGFLGDYKISMGVSKDNANHRGFIKMPGSMTVTARECSLCIDGPFPWVNVHGELESDGSFFASGSGTVAGYSGIYVTFAGKITDGQLIGDYTMGANGGLPGGQPIIYSVSGERLVPTPVPTSDPRLGEIQSFFDFYNESFSARDVPGLLSILHPQALGLYGIEACQDYLASVIENPVQIEALEITSSDPWKWEIDGHSALIEDAFTVQVAVTAGDQTAQQSMHLGLGEDGSLKWFTDCGEPIPTSDSDAFFWFGDDNEPVVLDDNYEVCGAGCNYNEGTAEQSKTMVWCTDTGCKSNGGACSLFNREKEDSPQDPDSWSYVAGPRTKMQKDWEYEYHCFCVK